MPLGSSALMSGIREHRKEAPESSLAPFSMSGFEKHGELEARKQALIDTKETNTLSFDFSASRMMSNEFPLSTSHLIYHDFYSIPN